MVGIARYPKGVGLMFGAGAPGVLIGGPIAGWIFDATGSYVIPFLVSGAVLASCALFLVRLPNTHGPPCACCVRRKKSASVVAPVESVTLDP